MGARTSRFLVALGLLAALTAVPALAQNVDAFLRVNNDRLQGADQDDRLLVFSPDPVAPGSSISHWDITATPNLLMEPSLNSDLGFLDLDLTPLQMQDIGWQTGTSTLNIFDLDPPGTGFTDPRPFAGAPGNNAATLGEARRNVFESLLGVWGSTLNSSVPIDVLVTWTPLPCSPTGGAALAGASTVFVFSGAGLPNPDVLYPAALTEAFAGEDLTGSPEENGGDIIVFMNVDIDEACLGAGTGYYYGLDGNAPSNLIDVSATILHELGHGLGMASFTDEATGEGFNGQLSIYDTFLHDNDQGMTWDEMTDAQRVQSAINDRGLAWTGPNVSAATAETLAPGVAELVVRAPREVEGTYNIGRAAFGGDLTADRLRGDLVCLENSTPDGILFDGCAEATNPSALAGNIALIERGTCGFTTKAANAQAAGAIAAVIYNNQGNTAIGLGGADDSITIPVVSVGMDDGMALREFACPTTELVVTDERFVITAEWETPLGESGFGRAVQLTGDTGYFWFFSQDNVEVVVKVLDGCSINGHFWVFAGGLTNVAVDLTITDTMSGQEVFYRNPQATAFEPIQNVRAFATCP